MNEPSSEARRGGVDAAADAPRRLRHAYGVGAQYFVRGRQRHAAGDRRMSYMREAGHSGDHRCKDAQLNVGPSRGLGRVGAVVRSKARGDGIITILTDHARANMREQQRRKSSEPPMVEITRRRRTVARGARGPSIDAHAWAGGGLANSLLLRE